MTSILNIGERMASMLTDKELYDLFKYGLKSTAKPNILIDVLERNAKDIEKRLSDDCFLLNCPYTNTTRNPMRIMIINRAAAIDHLGKLID